MEPLVRWLLTYLLHSTVLLGAAWLVRLALGERRLAVQEAVLRAALVGGFVTASLQVGLDVRPIGGTLAVPSARPAVALTPVPAPAPIVGSSRRARYRRLAGPSGRVVEPSAVGLGRGRDREHSLEGGARGSPGPPSRSSPWPGSSSPPPGCGACCAAAGRFGRASSRPGALLAAHALGLRRPVLSEAPRLSVPLATGVLRPEVCLPSRALGELGADEQVALCAHELAHLARRDPAWVLLARLVEALAPVQPMNAWARRRLSDLAECLSDDLAVSASARPLGLARSLVDVASWTLGERPLIPVAASGALSVRSRLGHRVERLMDPARAVERPRRALLPAAALVVLATALVTPVVSGSAVPPPAAPAQQKDAASPAQPVEAVSPTQPAEATPQTQPAPPVPPAGTAAAASKATPASRATAASKAEAALLVLLLAFKLRVAAF